MSAVGYALQRGRALRDPRAAFRYAVAASGRRPHPGGAGLDVEAVPDAWPAGIEPREIGRHLGLTVPETRS